MARQIKITDIEPSTVAKLIETNYKIRRVQFGHLTDGRSDFIEYLKRPLTISIIGVLLWIFLHMMFMHKTFSYSEGSNNASYLRQYIIFLLGNDLTYAFPFLSFSGLIKFYFNNKLNKIRIKSEV